MRQKLAKEYVHSVISQWRCTRTFGCGNVNDADDTDSISDLVLRKYSREVPKQTKSAKNTRAWLRQVKKNLALHVEIKRTNTDSTSDSNSCVGPSTTPSTIETISHPHSLSNANPASDPEEPIPAAVETSRVDSLPITDITVDSQLDDQLAPIWPSQRALTFDNSELPVFSRSDGLALTIIENTRRVHSLPIMSNTPSHTIGPLRRQRRNPQREAFFNVKVYDLGYGGDGEAVPSITSDQTQQSDGNKWWPDDYSKIRHFRMLI